jgi:hypothetical protein
VDGSADVHVLKPVLTDSGRPVGSSGSLIALARWPDTALSGVGDVGTAGHAEHVFAVDQEPTIHLLPLGP